MTVIKLEVWAFVEHFTKWVERGIAKALPILLEELKRLTPEDTKEMLNSYEVKQPIQIDWVIRWEITNNSDHAIYVEYGVNGNVYMYHKPKGNPFYSGVGNRTFARAVDNVRDRITSLIHNEINQW